jgi:hypothetical protein
VSSGGSCTALLQLRPKAHASAPPLCRCVRKRMHLHRSCAGVLESACVCTVSMQVRPNEPTSAPPLCRCTRKRILYTVSVPVLLIAQASAPSLCMCAQKRMRLHRLHAVMSKAHASARPLCRCVRHCPSLRARGCWKLSLQRPLFVNYTISQADAPTLAEPCAGKAQLSVILGKKPLATLPSDCLSSPPLRDLDLGH